MQPCETLSFYTCLAPGRRWDCFMQGNCMDTEVPGQSRTFHPTDVEGICLASCRGRKGMFPILPGHKRPRGTSTPLHGKRDRHYAIDPQDPLWWSILDCCFPPVCLQSTTAINLHFCPKFHRVITYTQTIQNSPITVLALWHLDMPRDRWWQQSQRDIGNKYKWCWKG